MSFDFKLFVDMLLSDVTTYYYQLWHTGENVAKITILNDKYLKR